MSLAADSPMREILTLLTSLLLLFSQTGSAETLLSVKPAKCVAMNKGQICYQKLRFQFSAPRGNYCLLAKSKKTPLICWQSSTSGQYLHAFQSNTDIEYSLVNENAVAVAKTNVAVAWVYKKSRTRNRWRLF